MTITMLLYNTVQTAGEELSVENTAFREQLDLYGAAFEKVLAEYLQSVRFRPDVLDESVRYSLQSGGKRLRPVLLFAVTRMLGGRLESVAPFALALELIHTYSLIHDDLSPRWTTTITAAEAFQSPRVRRGTGDLGGGRAAERGVPDLL